MNRSNIITLPHDSLRQRSVRVGIITDEIKQLVQDMKDATLDWEASRDHEVGVALAAVQVDSLYRVVIIRDDFNDKDNHGFQVLINPEIVKYEGEIEEEFEGCLSVKDVYGRVPRHTKVRVKSLNEHGREVRIRAEGFLARIFQHEIDHTNGKLFVDHIKGDDTAFQRLDKDGKIKEFTDAERSKIYIQIFE
ncbi:MAG: peptide deformylase [Candidatus Saccharimonadales bacterium]|jgi:peptide deformylase